MSQGLQFFKFDADAWLTGKIQLLTSEEKGIFIDLSARIWKGNGFLKNDEILHRLIRVEKGTLSNAIQAFLQLGIMCENNGLLSVKFIDSQLEQRREYIAKQSEIGKKGGRPKKGTKPKKKGDILDKRERENGKPNQDDEKEPPKNDAGISPAGENNPPAPDVQPKSGYPQTADDVIRIAQSPQCGMKCTKEQAEYYLACRQANDWHNAFRNKIPVGGVPQDIKIWLIRDEQKQQNERKEKDYYASGRHIGQNGTFRNDPI